MQTVSRLTVATIAAIPSLAYGQATVTTVASPDDPGAPAATSTRVSLTPGHTPGSDLAALLAEVPGVHARRTSHGQTSFATIRGGNARQLSVELEGLRLDPPFGPGFDLSSTSLLGLDEVTVWRGPAATFRGSGALTGALAFRTRHPRSDGAGARLYAMLGSHQTSEIRAEAGVADDGLSVRLGASHRYGEGSFSFVDAQGVTHQRANNDHQRVGLFGSAENRSGPTTVRATAAYDAGDRGTPGQSEFQEQYRLARLSDRRLLGLVRAERRVADRADGWIVAGHQMRMLRYENPEPFLAAEPILEEAVASSTQAAAGTSIWRPRDTGMFELEGAHEGWRADNVDAERLTAGLGGSWERRFADDRLGAWGGARAEVAQSIGIAALPSIGAWWQSLPSLRFHVTGGRTHRAPDFDELHLEAESVRGNPDLVPESAWSADVGARWTGDDIGASLVAFGRRVDHEILFLPVTAYLVEATNVEGSRALGVEASANARWFGRLDTDFSYALVDARFVENAVRVPLQPAHSAFARAAIDILRAPRSLRAVLEVDARSSIFLDTFANQTARGAAFLDAGVVGGSELVWSVFVRNLLDDRGAVDALQQPIPGRTLWASIRLGRLP